MNLVARFQTSKTEVNGLITDSMNEKYSSRPHILFIRFDLQSKLSAAETQLKWVDDKYGALTLNGASPTDLISLADRANEAALAMTKVEQLAGLFINMMRMVDAE